MAFALRWEARAFLRAYRPFEPFHSVPCPVYRCRRGPATVLVAEVGVGRACRPCVDWLLHRPVLGDAEYQPRLVLSAGFSGALHEDFRVGDIVVATEVVDSSGHTWPTTWPPAGREVPFRRTRLLSVDALVGIPEQKQTLGVTYQASAVDMETATLAQWCAESAAFPSAASASSPMLCAQRSPRPCWNCSTTAGCQVPECFGTWFVRRRWPPNWAGSPGTHTGRHTVGRRPWSVCWHAPISGFLRKSEKYTGIGNRAGYTENLNCSLRWTRFGRPGWAAPLLVSPRKGVLHVER